MNGAYRHIVLFRVHDSVPDATVAEAVAALRALGALPGVMSWRVEESLDVRKGRVLVEDATFGDEAAFLEFRATPEHTAVAAAMAEIADWWNGDYLA